MTTLALLCGYVICGLIGLIGLAILWNIFDGTIDLSRLISEANGDASMSRFQFLVFTFVISMSLFLVIVSGKDGNGKPAFPETIPAGILTLLGISGSSYAVGKAIQFSDPAGLEDRPVTVTITPTDATVRYGQTQKFVATVARKPDAKVKWEVTRDRGTIDADGLYHAPAAPVPAPTAPQHATVKATCVDYPDVSDVAVISLA
jgi:Big-like domain-containing protein